MLTKFKKIIIFLLIFISIDFIISLFLFNLIFLNLENIYKTDLQNRVFNKNYKYTFKPNVEFISRYNDFLYTIKTNNFGFRDKNNKDVEIKNKLILFAGDSFLEGVGLNYKDTLIAHLNKYNIDENTYLNSGVGSYSPFIYKKKIISFLEKNPSLKLDRVVVLLDKSDPLDDQSYLSEPDLFNENSNLRKYRKNLSERFISLAFLKIFGSFLDEKRRDLKYRYIISKKYKTNFFKLNKNQITAYKSIKGRSSLTSHYDNSDKWENKTKKLLLFSFKQLKEIELFLTNKNIKFDVFLYPWPFELANKKVRKNYLNFINDTNKEFNINIHSCYDYFLKENILEQLDLIGNSFLLGDFHYNSEGNKIFADCIKAKIRI